MDLNKAAAAVFLCQQGVDVRWCSPPLHPHLVHDFSVPPPSSFSQSWHGFTGFLFSALLSSSLVQYPNRKSSPAVLTQASEPGSRAVLLLLRLPTEA